MDRVILQLLDAGLIGAVLTVIIGSYFYRRQKFRIEDLEASLKYWQTRHSEVVEMWQGSKGAEQALAELMFSRLGFTEQGAREAIKVWKANGWGGARIGGASIASFKRD